jgi:hypothetical protein
MVFISFQVTLGMAAVRKQLLVFGKIKYAETRLLKNPLTKVLQRLGDPDFTYLTIDKRSSLVRLYVCTYVL